MQNHDIGFTQQSIYHGQTNIAEGYGMFTGDVDENQMANK
jgi:hypothetical protein